MTNANTCIVAFDHESDTDPRENVYTCAVCATSWMLAPWDTEDLPCAGLPTGTYTVG